MNKLKALLLCSSIALSEGVFADVCTSPVVVQHSSNTDWITYGYTADVRATRDDVVGNYSVGAQINSHNLATEGSYGYSFGIATESWNAPRGSATIHQIGLESSVISLNSESEGAKVGIDINIKNRPDGVSAPAYGVGSDKFNHHSRAIQIDSQSASPLGETLGWNIGIDFRENALGGMAGSEPVAIDLSKVKGTGFAIMRVVDRVNGNVYRMYVDNGVVVLEVE